MKSFNQTSVKALVLVASVLASQMALAQTGKANGGLMNQMTPDSYKVSAINTAEAQQQLQQVQIAAEPGNGGLAAAMQTQVQSPVAPDAQQQLDSIHLGNASTEGHN